jgi:glycosyltransferase involved in cell wall biosynthesis
VNAKLAVATSFPIFPPRGGGQVRVLGLYSALAARGIEIEIVALVDRSERGGAREIAAGVREVRVPKTREHDSAEWVLQQQAGVPVTDLALALHHDLTPAYGEALKEAARDASAVVCCHPFPHPVFAGEVSVPVVYEAQDVEADLKAQIYERAPELAERVRSIEHDCVVAAHHVIVCAGRDAERLGELYGADPASMVVVPNGSDPAAVAYTGLAERHERRTALGVADFLALFVGSWHEPNLLAVLDLLGVAGEAEGIRFVIVGSAGLAFADRPLPGNVDLCGSVDDGFLQAVLRTAGAALNPMRIGSGTNLKMLEYALAGVPLVSSEFGARGLDMEPGVHYLAAHPPDFATAVLDLRDEAPVAVKRRVAAAREHVLRRFTWSAIADSWLRSQPLQDLVGELEGVACR